jgi:transcription-repair coupling factor (superfamily II helicase)
VVPQDSWWALAEPAELTEEANRLCERMPTQAILAPTDLFSRIYRFPSVTLSAIAPSSLESTAQLAIESVERFTGQLDRVCHELDTVGKDQEVWIVAPTEAEERRLAELLAASAPAQANRLHFARGRLSAGFRLVPEKLVLISAAELFRRHDTPQSRLPKHRLARAIDTFLDLHEGDLVVHVAHGIARYRGLKLLEKHGRTEEFLELEFAESTRIYVPASAIELVQKYIGGGKSGPKLAKIGGTLWAKQKRAVEKAVADMAADMLQIQAVRSQRPGRAFPADTPWQTAFEQSFQFDPTPDQATASEDIRADLEQPKPMDRLLCGDVGFGKTELAMRAAFKVAESGGQVAVLVPTTVLAEQHRRTFTERFAEYPFTIRGLSRMTPTREVRETLEGLASGSVDIVIGTHRLAQADIHFANLGLVVVDEEQRFGVDVKERLKALRASVDVLTMTATPIPRTLHMAMLGIRDISNLTTPPANRQAVETRVSRFDETLIRHAIDRELARDGQIFFVHNRIQDIQKIADKIRGIMPDISIGIAHGRLNETELEQVMVDFVAGRTQVLLATTIIESGLDIPRANTIFIDEADHYGLADLHQLRGRVGRSHHRAYCYLLVREATRLTTTAARRLRAIQEFSSTGAGFSLAMRDLEIRGAGNLLGTQQSGHIATVGYELYCRLLENAVRGLKALPPTEPPPVAIDLPGDAWLPRDYIADLRTKIDVYRRISRASSQAQVDELSRELPDRFGPLPAAASRLLALASLRIAAAARGVDSLSRQPGLLVIGHHDIRRIERWRKTCQMAGHEVRFVGTGTAVVPLKQRVAEDPDRLLAFALSLFGSSRKTGENRTT